ncbi:MAG: cyclic nucleotide-binding domain-containing protein [Gallionella sp.]
MFRHDPEFIEIKQGEHLFCEGDHGDVMYILIEGKAEITISGMHFENCQPGNFMGELAVIDGSPRYATVTALNDCKFVVVDNKRFHFLVDESPKFAIDVMRVMAQRLRNCDQRILAAKIYETQSLARVSNSEHS